MKNNLLNYSRIYFYLFAVYIVIFLQYPFSLAVGQFVFNVDLASQIQPSYLLLWGAVRILIVLPLIFYLVRMIPDTFCRVYLQLGDKNRMISFTFWGTIAFTLLGIILYPQFLHQSKLSLQSFLYLFPFFSLFSISNAFVEETFFRGSTLALLNENMRFWQANFIQAILFALIHIVNPMSRNLLLFVFLTFILGLFWGYLTAKTKSLIPAIVLHIIADLFVAISLF